MNQRYSALIAVSLLYLTGCATSQEVLLAKQSPAPVVSVAQVPDEGNSPEMDAHLRAALVKEGYTVRSPLPAGTRKSEEADAIISYVDVWRWDIVMYLQSITIRMFDAKSGDLLATGTWKDSTFHAYRNAEAVVGQLVAEMTTKVRSAASGTTTTSSPEGDLPAALMEQPAPD